MSESETSAVIHISRAMQLGGFGVRAKVTVDGAEVGALWIGKSLTATVPPGRRVIQVEGKGLGAFTIEPGLLKTHVAPGEVAAFQVVIQKGLMKNSFTLERVARPRPS